MGNFTSGPPSQLPSLLDALGTNLRPLYMLEWHRHLDPASCRFPNPELPEISYAEVERMVIRVFGEKAAARMKQQRREVYLWYYITLYAELGRGADAVEVLHGLANSWGRSPIVFSAFDAHRDDFADWAEHRLNRQYIAAGLNSGLTPPQVTTAFADRVPVDYLLVAGR